MISLKNISKTYKNGVNALHEVDLEIAEGEFVYIIGPTGCGKSTLIKVLDGEEIPTKGTCVVNGIDVGKLKHSKVPKYRRNLGVVFQDYRLLEHKTVSENIAFAMECIGAHKNEIRERVNHILEVVDLVEKRRSFPKELSGGQQQRVAIARAIANKPKVLIADEPTGNLDASKASEILSLLNKINQEEKTTVVVVTHDMNLIEKFPHRTIRLAEGHIVSDTLDIYSRKTESNNVESVVVEQQVTEVIVETVNQPVVEVKETIIEEVVVNNEELTQGISVTVQSLGVEEVK